VQVLLVVAAEVLTTAGVWQPIAAGTDKHGTTGWVDGKLQLEAVIEPPFGPVTVRAAWTDFPECMLFNSKGYPVAPFNLTVDAPPHTASIAAAAVRPSQWRLTIAVASDHRSVWRVQPSRTRCCRSQQHLQQWGLP
jgi:hypothetical protein